MNSGRGRGCRERAESEMVSIATATLKCSLSKWGCDKVEQTAVSEHVKYSRQRKLTQTNVRLRPASQFGQRQPNWEAAVRQAVFPLEQRWRLKLSLKI